VKDIYSLKLDSLNNVKRLQDNNNNIDHTKDSEITVLLPPIEISCEEQRALGYMPLRDDFERVIDFLFVFIHLLIFLFFFLIKGI
jgi:hypothetical protein